MNKILSFIIPSYNSERFLNKCVDSMIEDSVMDQLEIIIVNDGSQDNTETIAQSYLERFPETFCVISQENRGHGGALNAGCAVWEPAS